MAGRLLRHLETELHARVVVADDTGHGAEGGAGLAEKAGNGGGGGEELVGIIEEAEVGAIHTYDTGLVEQTKGALHLQDLRGGIEGVGTCGDGAAASGDAEGLVLIEGVGGGAGGDTDFGEIGAELLFDISCGDFAAGLGQEVLALEADFGLAIGPGANESLLGHGAAEEGAEEAVEDTAAGSTEYGGDIGAASGACSTGCSENRAEGGGSCGATAGECE